MMYFIESQLDKLSDLSIKALYVLFAFVIPVGCLVAMSKTGA